MQTFQWPQYQCNILCGSWGDGGCILPFKNNTDRESKAKNKQKNKKKYERKLLKSFKRDILVCMATEFQKMSGGQKHIFFSVKKLGLHKSKKISNFSKSWSNVSMSMDLKKKSFEHKLLNPCKKSKHLLNSQKIG